MGAGKESRLTRRAWLRHTTAAAGAAPVAACGTAAAPQETKPAVSKAPVELSYATNWSAAEKELLVQNMGPFREAFPHISINYAPHGADALVSAFSAGGGPDVLVITGQIGPRLYEGGQLVDLTERVKAARLNLEKDYISSKLEKWGPKVFALPHTVSPHAWYYNKTMLRRAGARDPWDDLKGAWTWADLLEMCKRVTRTTPGAVGPDDVWGMELNYINPWNQNSGFIWTNGGKIIDTSAGPTEWRRWKYTLSDPRTLEGHQYVYDLLHVHRVLISREQATEQRRATPNLFSAQKTALFEQSSGQLETQLSARNVFDWDIAPIPLVKPGGKKGVPLWSGNPTALNKASTHVDAGWDLAREMALEHFQTAFSRGKFLTAALIKALTIPGGFESPPPAHISTFRAVGIENSGSWDYHPAFQEIQRIVEAELGLAFLQQKSLRQASLDIDSQANAILARS